MVCPPLGHILVVCPRRGTPRWGVPLRGTHCWCAPPKGHTQLGTFMCTLVCASHPVCGKIVLMCLHISLH